MFTIEYHDTNSRAICCRKKDTRVICTLGLKQHFSHSGHLLDKKQQNKKAVEPYIMQGTSKVLSRVRERGMFYMGLLHIFRVYLQKACSCSVASSVRRVFAIISKFFLYVCSASLKLL